MSCTKLCASGSELCSLHVIYKLTREANNLNTLGKIALNVRLPRLFAAKFVSNESWIIWEHTYLSESQEETILSQHFSSLFVGLLGEFFPITLAQTSQTNAPLRAKCRLSLPPRDVFARQLWTVTAPCLVTNCARPEINFQPTYRANLNFVNKTKVEFQFAQFVCVCVFFFYSPKEVSNSSDNTDMLNIVVRFETDLSIAVELNPICPKLKLHQKTKLFLLNTE